MYRRFSILVAVMAMLVMALSPLYEFFDRWDNIPATGNDTALTLIVLAACVGVSFGMAARIVLLVEFVLSFVKLLPHEPAPVAHSHHHALEYERILFSPPLSMFSLRI